MTRSPPRYVRKPVGGDVIKFGNCYEQAGDRLLHTAGNADGYRLVHGIAEYANGMRLPHAWVEQPDGTVWDPAIANRGSNAIVVREALARYTKAEMVAVVLKTKHWGPW